MSSRWGRFQVGKGGGSYRPKRPNSSGWADSILAADKTLPREDAYRAGMVAAHTLQVEPDAQGHWNPHHHKPNGAANAALWDAGHEHAKTLIEQRGV